jgi:hypothetical protein
MYAGSGYVMFVTNGWKLRKRLYLCENFKQTDMKKSEDLLKRFMLLLTEKAVIKANPIMKNGKETGETYGKEIADLFRETQEYLNGNKDLSPYNPAHGQFGDNCCGIFCHINDDGILCCNECLMTINELVEPLSL